MTRPIPLPDYAAKAPAEGRLTQWRVRLRVQPSIAFDALFSDGDEWWTGDALTGEPLEWLQLPFSPGDSLWVQETWRPTLFGDCPVIECKNGAGGDEYLGNAKPITVEQFDAVDGPRRGWRSPVTMPKWASRWDLVVESVRVERVQDATEDDALAEGFTDEILGDQGRASSTTALGVLVEHWIARHGPGSWERNDWCASAAVEVRKGNCDE